MVGGRAWRDMAPARVTEFGADLCVEDAPALLDVLRERLPPVADED